MCDPRLFQSIQSNDFVEHYLGGRSIEPELRTAVIAALGHVTAAMDENNVAFLQDLFTCEDCRSKAGISGALEKRV